MSRTIEDVLGEINNGYDYEISDYATSTREEKILERAKKTQLAKALKEIETLLLENLPKKFTEVEINNMDRIFGIAARMNNIVIDDTKANLLKILGGESK
jgi:hypothetical protein